MTKKYIIGIDEGTTSVRAGVFDVAKNKFISTIQRELKLYYPKPGWVELDAEEIFEKQRKCVVEVAKTANIKPEQIYGIGITNQRETVVVWDKQTGKPVCKAICWQCRRTAQEIDNLTQKQKELIKEKTGLIPDAYFSATKIAWILKNVKETKNLLQSHNLMCGTIDSYLTFKFTGQHVTDTTNASRTMLFNIKTLQWDDELLKMFGIPKEILPKVVKSSEIVGETNVLGENIPVSGIGGDQQCALIGQTCFEKGSIKTTYGTGGFLLVNTGDEIHNSDKLLTTIAYTIGNKTAYALEGSIFNCGSTVQWLRDNLFLIKKSSETEKMAYKVDSNGGVYIVPAFTGLGCPHWDMTARGAIVGLTRGVNKNHIARAVLESMAYQTQDIIAEMQSADINIKTMKCDGGASVNKFLMQFQSDLSHINILLPQNLESTMLGAVYLAGLSTGSFESTKHLQKLWQQKAEYKPQKSKNDMNKLYSVWKKAVEKSKNWI